jgi:arsenate reductase
VPRADADRVFNVLFLCTGNSARSLLAEACLNAAGRPRFRAFSAGSHPTGRVNPLALELLDRLGLPSRELRSKAWDEFAAPGAPTMDIVITVCDQAAGEACPLWPGRPVTARWGVPDPAAVNGDDAAKRAAFEAAFAVLSRRIRLLVDLPLETLDAPATERCLRAIGAQA